MEQHRYGNGPLRRYREDDVAVVDYYNCERCGRSYEIFEPREEERDTDYAKYWNGNHD